MVRLCLLFLLTAVIFPTKTESARILCIFSMPCKSHQRMFQPLTQELARRGHEVTVFTHHPSVNKNGRHPERYTEIDMINVVQFDMEKYFDKLKVSPTYKPLVDDNEFYEDIHEATTKHLQYVKMALGNYSKDHFDLIFLESAIRQFLVFSHIFNAPVIRISCCGAFPHDYPEIGAATHPFLYPAIGQKKICNLLHWEKMKELINYFYVQLILMPKLYSLENKQIGAIFGQDFPPVEELINNVDMLFLNMHPLWEGNVPVPPNVVHLWGMHLKKSSNLSTDIQYLLNSSTNGIVYMSFGSTAKTSWLPNTTIQAITRALSRVPYDVFLKWEEDILPEKPKNVHIRKWWPQEDLLRHPKVKLFITHGGLFSTQEAIVGGVPVISIPFFGDQCYNAEKCVQQKIGVKLEFEEITEDTFYSAINTILEDDTYRRNIIKLRSLMMDQPESALERAVWWTEYVLRHSGAKHLRSPAANISWAQYYEIELVLCIICVLFFMFICTSLSFYLCFKGFLKFCRKVSLKSLRINNSSTNVTVTKLKKQ